MRTGMLFVALVGVTLLAAPTVRGHAVATQEKSSEKEKTQAKDKDQGKAKPPVRSFTDEDLKKYKDKPRDDSAKTQGGSSNGPSNEQATTGHSRSREYGGYQELPPTPPGSQENEEQQPQAEAGSDESAGRDAKSPEEVEWRARAKSARQPLEAARARVRDIESQMSDLRDLLNPMSSKYLLGGTSTAGPNQIYETEEKLRNLESELSGAKTDLADAQKSWQQFLDEARAAGASPAWLTP